MDDRLTLNAYQEQASFTAPSDLPEYLRLATYALGIAGEAGEVADMIKKELGHGHETDRVKLAKELGDVLWYVAALARLYGWTLSEVGQMNIDKLRARYPGGFSSEASINRTEATDQLELIMSWY